ncbi:MAG: hypothetical protein PHD86_08415 [Kiritimatiellae bacterium]|nr:hypothetical protein [Kiritimatiellia bacterium]
MKKVWNGGHILRTALEEQRRSIASVYDHARALVETPPGTEPDFQTSLESIPISFYSARKNIFSTLFQSAYQLLDIAPVRRHLYGQLIHLFRIWVTSADNLLDDEDKIVLPVRLPGASHVMGQVVSLMAADRVMNCILDEAVQAGVISGDQGRELSRRSLQVLLPSAAQEASEEGGVTDRPEPEYVLHTIHRLKTGLLFHIPFLGPEVVEDSIDTSKMQRVKGALLDFGLGCQLLDDVRDMARDYVERRHNYCLSVMARDCPEPYRRLAAAGLKAGDRLYQDQPMVVLPAVRRGLGLLSGALAALGEEGLGIPGRRAESMSRRMLAMLDLGDLQYA